MDCYIYRNQNKMRCGFTTGTCGAAAAKAAAWMLLGNGKDLEEISLVTPNGTKLTLPVLDIKRGSDYVSCAIKKDSGDDPDITNGILVYATVEKRETGIIIDGGAGVGRVTQEGLDQPVGAAAINRVPRKMIEEGVLEACEQFGYKKGLSIIISVPEGERLCRQTFNPRLGIVGGISILGSSGIVEPMSEKALVDTIEAEFKIYKAKKISHVIGVLGNYGERYVKEELGLSHCPCVKMSNYIGESIDLAVSYQMESFLIVGNMGKLVKLAAGIMNTHSKAADGRFEIMGVHGAMEGASRETVKKIMESITTDQAMDLLEKEGILGLVLQSILKKMESAVQKRAGDQMKTGVILFSEKRGFLGQTSHAADILKKHQ